MAEMQRTPIKFRFDARSAEGVYLLYDANYGLA